MTKYLFLFLFGVLFFSAAKAQKESDKDTLTYYCKDNGQVTVKDSADYSLLILPKSPSNKKLYPVLEFYKNGKPKLSVLSSTHSLDLILEGPGTAFYPNGSKKQTINYRNGKLSGYVTEFYPNGKIYTLREYIEYNRYNEVKYIECWDSTGVAFAKKGNGKWIEYDDDFRFPVRQVSVKNGTFSKIWQPIIDTLMYPAYDKTGPVMTNVKVMPLYKSDIIELNHLLQKNLDYPIKEETGKISGDVLVTMVVEKNGALTHFKVIYSSSKNLSDEAIRLIGLSCPWVPGFASIDGPPVRVQMGLILSFNTEPSFSGTAFNTVRVSDVNNLTTYKIVNDEGYNTTGDILLAADVDKQPEFPGGQSAFIGFLTKNIKYSAIDAENWITGKVYIEFIVEKDGKLSNIQALGGPSQTLNEEAARVTKLSPLWAPGMKNDKSVRVAYNIPIVLTLDSDSLKWKAFHLAEQPEFPGGIEAFGRFLGNNIHYPEIDRKNGMTGKVIVTFIVEKDGSISDVRAVRGPSETLKAESVRVLELSPKWKPGEQNGKPVRVTYTVPVNFTLNVYK